MTKPSAALGLGPLLPDNIRKIIIGPLGSGKTNVIFIHINYVDLFKFTDANKVIESNSVKQNYIFTFDDDLNI